MQHGTPSWISASVICVSASAKCKEYILQCKGIEGCTDLKRRPPSQEPLSGAAASPFWMQGLRLAGALAMATGCCCSSSVKLRVMVGEEGSMLTFRMASARQMAATGSSSWNTNPFLSRPARTPPSRALYKQIELTTRDTFNYTARDLLDITQIYQTI